MSRLTNKQTERTNRWSLSTEQEDKPKKPKYDRVFYILLVGLGLAGLAYVLTSPYSTVNQSENSQFVNDEESASTKAQPERLLLDTNESPRKHKSSSAAEKYIRQTLRISEEREAEEVLKFIIDSYDENAIYHLDLGNGFVKKLYDKNSYYSYPKAGQFEIRLLVSYNDQPEKSPEVIFTEKVTIYKAIEVPEGILEYDN